MGIGIVYSVTSTALNKIGHQCRSRRHVRSSFSATDRGEYRGHDSLVVRCCGWDTKIAGHAATHRIAASCEMHLYILLARFHIIGIGESCKGRTRIRGARHED